MSDEIRACPECGNEVEHTCYHDGEDLQSVQMPRSQAQSLRELEARDRMYALKLTALDDKDLALLQRHLNDEVMRRNRESNE